MRTLKLLPTAKARPPHKSGRAKEIEGEESPSTFWSKIIMSHYLLGKSVSPLAERRPFSWRAFLHNGVELARNWARRRQQRQELLEYLAIDHRAAADLGIPANDAHEWAERSFWRS
jgi:uncharacterized protein YjiS (DUF1127 family)